MRSPSNCRPFSRVPGCAATKAAERSTVRLPDFPFYETDTYLTDSQISIRQQTSSRDNTAKKGQAQKSQTSLSTATGSSDFENASRVPACFQLAAAATTPASLALHM